MSPTLARRAAPGGQGYSKVDRRRGKLTKNDTDALQEKVRNLDTIVTTLRQGSDQEAVILLQRIRATISPSLLQLALPDGHVIDDRHESSQKVVEFNTQMYRVYLNQL
ncbi:hypothetical protein H2200_008117 [Cladophialophora chaetospira]|uniref:Uncharacterized protein n=1 Tax=Cladophialophora chaetospira TaxID=386627 RepID=A0AA39CG60_9EURO|nr:hypothetical protein H2200_008117 [Cladophialophora chaetospira]